MYRPSTKGWLDALPYYGGAFFLCRFAGGGIPPSSHFPRRKLVAIATAWRRASGINTTKTKGF
nr:MAG TPA: hypothetical protein [Caudoviricetes sp.]